MHVIIILKSKMWAYEMDWTAVWRSPGLYRRSAALSFHKRWRNFELFQTRLYFIKLLKYQCPVNVSLVIIRSIQYCKWLYIHVFVEIKCQLDATEVFIAELIACSTCFGHHYAHHQELESIIQCLLPVVFRARNMLSKQ